MKVIETPERDTWICRKCDTHNPIESHVCLQCGVSMMAFLYPKDSLMKINIVGG